MLGMAFCFVLLFVQDTTASPVQVPLYITSSTDYSPNRYQIYAGVNGGALLPYNFDTGAPNFFTVVGAQGGTATDSFTFAQAPTYNYFVNPVTVTLGTREQDVRVTTGTVNLAAVVSITDNGETHLTTGSALADGTYGDFGAGLYGTSTLGTILAQMPLADGLQNGWWIDVAGKADGVGTLTIGLTTEMIQNAKAAPGAITMLMDKSGQQIPTATGLIDGYNKAQVANTTVSLTNGGTTITKTLPTVFDTGGGPNVVIYDPDFLPAAHGQVEISYGGTSFVNYNGTTPWGGAVVVDGDTSGGLRVNPGGATIFENYQVLFHVPSNSLDVGELILIPLPEPSTGALVVLGIAAGVLLRARKKHPRARSLLAFMPMLVAIALLGGGERAQAQLTIPLELVNIGTHHEPIYKLGIWVGLGGGSQRLYEFDTGGPGFWAGYSDNLDHGVNQWWGNFTPTGQTAQTTYSSGTTYQANIVSTSIQIYANGTDATPLHDTGFQTISVAQIYSATLDGNDIFQPIRQDQPFLQGHFFGDFGASLMPAISGATVLYGVLPQIPVADLPGSNLDTGFIVNTGGFANASPSVTLGITPEDNARFTTQVQMNQATGYQYPTTNVQAYEERVITGTMTLSNTGGSTGPLVAPLILDTGAPTGSIHPGGEITELVLDPYLTGVEVTPGTEITFTAAGAAGYNSWTATFTANTTTGLNKFAVDANSQNPDAVNMGLLGFNAYETMFNLSTGNVGFIAVPEPRSVSLLVTGAVLLAGAYHWRRKHRKQKI